MTLSLALPPCSPSPLGRLDPRWKLAALALAVAAVALLNTLTAALLALAAAVLLAVLGRLSWRWLRGRLLAALAFVALFAAPLPWLLWEKGSAWAWGPLVVSPYGARAAALLLARAAALVLLVLVGLATSPLEDNLKAAHALFVPGLFVHIALLTYRYLFVLGGEWVRLRIALRVRGFRNRPTGHSYRTIGQAAGTLLVRGAERAERVGQAMRCRGFDGRFRSLTAFRTRAADVLAFLAVVAAAVGLVWLDRLPG
jgi:cobalt/nickel transport system permease protein